LVFTAAVFDDIGGSPIVRNQLLAPRKKSQNELFQQPIGEVGLAIVGTQLS
jgi:hypothetical protein